MLIASAASILLGVCAELIRRKLDRRPAGNR
jgi:hypothetical protein